MALPSPNDYTDWKAYMHALLAAMDAGAIAEMISGDPYASAVVAQAGVGNNAPPGYSPVWLEDDSALLYLGNDSGPPVAGSLFSVDTTNLADAAITFAKIEAGAVGTTSIANAAITNALILDGTILSAKIGDAQIVEAKIADLAVNTAKIANLAVSSAKIANLAVGTAQIDALAVTTAKIATANITTALIADAAITNAKIGSLAVDTANIANGAITNAKIGSLAVDTAQIATAAITSAKIANLAVGSAAIADAAILTAKIADLNVSTLKIAGYAVDTTKLGSQAVSVYDTVEATGTQVVSGTPTQVTLGGTQVEVSITTPNITGDMSVLIFVKAAILGSIDDDSIFGDVRVGGSSLSPFLTAGTHFGGDNTMVIFDIHDAPTANTTYTYEFFIHGDSSYSVEDANMVAMLLKR